MYCTGNHLPHLAHAAAHRVVPAPAGVLGAELLGRAVSPGAAARARVLVPNLAPCHVTRGE